MVCKHCGITLPEGISTDPAQVCPQCGNKVDPIDGHTIRASAVQYRERMHDTRRGGTAPIPSASATSRRTDVSRAQIKHHTETPQTMVQPADPIKPSPTRTRTARIPQLEQTAQSASKRPGKNGNVSSTRPQGSSRPSLSRSEKQTDRLLLNPSNRHGHARISAEKSAPLPSYEGFSWLRLLAIAVLCVAVLTVGLYFFLSKTQPGQQLLAEMGMDAPAAAYMELGHQRMQKGAIGKAVTALEIAQSKDPNNLEILMELGAAYEGNNQLDRAELAYKRAIQFYPAYPEPYRRIIELYLETDRKYEAIECMTLALARTGEENFSQMLSNLRPKVPHVSVLSGNYQSAFDVTLDAEEGTEIRYTLDDTDPYSGKKYKDPIHLEEGAWKLRAVAMIDDMASEEQIQTYVVRRPAPDMPTTNLATDTYDTVREVRLRGGADVVTIYYTTDGSEPSLASRKYENPIKLRVGKTQIRAIAVNSIGKISNELNVLYDCEGRVKTSFAQKDTFTSLALQKTTKEDFIKRYGEPESEQGAGSDDDGTYTRLNYGFGYAVFLQKANGNAPVLVELSTHSTQMIGPRKAAVGMSVDDVLALFRDEGGEDDGQGNRILYNLTNGNMGMLQQIGPTTQTVRYYCKLETNEYIEFSLFCESGRVEHMEWLRYRAAK